MQADEQKADARVDQNIAETLEHAVAVVVPQCSASNRTLQRTGEASPIAPDHRVDNVGDIKK